MYEIPVADAVGQLPKLIDAAMRGETIVIMLNEQQSVQLVPHIKTKTGRKAGSAKGMISMADDFDAPLDDFAEYIR